jgi:nitrate reductase gamma subunit
MRWGRYEVYRVETLKKAIIPLLISMICLLWICPPAAASWLIDAGKFHISAHGRTSCRDCHEEVRDRALHPNPEDVNKGIGDFFHVDHCLACHEGILDDLEGGSHGGKEIEDSEKYKACMACHRPHEQLRIEDTRPGRFDPAVSRHEQCGVCHEKQPALPPLSLEDEACMTCHGSSGEDPGAVERIAGLCLHCHARRGQEARELTGTRASLIDPDEYASSPHAGVGCTICHPGAAQFGHHLQKGGDCGQCHLRHDEKVAHDAHLEVACEACHLRGITPVRDPETKRIRWTRERAAGRASPIHQMVRGDDESCGRCHFKGNPIGAAAMILPAKGILCMPCHGATFSVGDTTTALALIIFLAGMVMTFAWVLTGAMEKGGEESSVSKFLRLLGHGLRAVFSPGIVPIVKTLFLDVILQRRLYRQSSKRWFIHGLIFWPFLVRFCWGIVALIGSLWKPDWPIAWAMLDRNNPAGALLFDLSGIVLFLGVLLAFIRGAAREPERAAGLPKQDRFALFLIAAIVVMGFVLEGMRIAMTGAPPGAGYGFIGYAVALLFTGSAGLSAAYGYLWYVHAVLTGIFVAYLPFSRLIHIIVGPVVLAMNAVSEFEHGGKSWMKK